MKDIKLKFTDKLDENQLAQEINSIEEINNPVIKNNNPEPVKDIKKETTPTSKPIEDMIDPIPELNEDTVIDTPEPVIEERIKSKNTVRYIDSGFTF